MKKLWSTLKPGPLLDNVNLVNIFVNLDMNSKVDEKNPVLSIKLEKILGGVNRLKHYGTLRGPRP